MLFKSKLAAAITVVLLAGAWVMLGSLIGLGVGPSLAVAAVSAVAAVPWLVHRSSHRPRRRSKGTQPSRAEQRGPQRAARFGDSTKNRGRPVGASRDGVRDDVRVQQLPRRS